MANNNQKIKLKDFLIRSDEALELEDDVEYKQVTVKMHTAGVILRGKKIGSQIGTKKQYVARTGQLILSKIDARNGAFGLVPKDLDGAIVTQDFPLLYFNTSIIIPKYFYYLVKSNVILEFCIRASKGTTNRQRLKLDKFLDFEVVLPPLAKQEEVVKTLDTLSHRLEHITSRKRSLDDEFELFVKKKFFLVTDNVGYRKMKDVAPIIRRKVEIDENKEYPELGIRSFGKGTFHKPALQGSEVGSKKLYEIHENDLLFSNVFSWEGAIAVVDNEDHRRYGSHRFISCVCKHNVTNPHFLKYYFLTEEGLKKIRQASPGSAGRNRTLGLKKLEEISVPVPLYEDQKKFVKLLAFANKIYQLKDNGNEKTTELWNSALHKEFIKFEN